MQLILHNLLRLSLTLLFTLLQPAHLLAAPGDIYVSFHARPTTLITKGGRSVGHTFFCITLHLNSGPKEECFGFYPEDPKDPTTYFNKSGTVSNEFKLDAIENVSVSLQHKISENTRKDLYGVIQKWAGANYNLLVSNCGDFVFAVAKAAGLRTPDRSSILLPTEFVEGLRKLYWMGLWSSSEGRFQLDVGTSDVGWSERNSAGVDFEVKIPFTSRDGKVQMDRPNDDKVLSHLGYQTSIRSQILAAGPKPSFLIMERIDQRIDALWNGLLVIKDTNAKLKEIKQPGTTPAKPYTFDRL